MFEFSEFLLAAMHWIVRGEGLSLPFILCEKQVLAVAGNLVKERRGTEE